MVVVPTRSTPRLRQQPRFGFRMVRKDGEQQAEVRKFLLAERHGRTPDREPPSNVPDR